MLTIRQHVIPARSLGRFTNIDGFVQVSTANAINNVLSLKPSNKFFTLARVWDQRSESGWMKQIEDSFQTLVDDILSKRIVSVAGENIATVAYFFSLWYWRSRQEPQIETELQFKGITGSSLTHEEEEQLEKRYIMFARLGGRVPARFLTGLNLQKQTDEYAHSIKDWTWGIIQAKSGEFLMPDVPNYGFLPISPKVLLAANHPNGMILKTHLKKINIALLSYTWKYFIARNIGTAMSGISIRDIKKSVKARDKQLAGGASFQGSIAAAADQHKSTA